MPRQLSVLGSQAAYPTLHNPCSSFLVTWDSFNLVLDLGYNTLQPLLRHISPFSLNAIVITHEHPDHWIDVHALLRLLYHDPRSAQRKVKPALYCTRGTADKVKYLEPDLLLEEIVDLNILFDGCTFTIGPLQLFGVLLPHWVQNIGIRLEVLYPDRSGASLPLLAYTGDTGPTSLLAELGRNTQLFILDATDREGESEKKAEERNLMTSSEAGHLAAKAGATKVLLTHFWPGNNKQAAVGRATEHFNGEVLAAEPGLVVNLDIQ